MTSREIQRTSRVIFRLALFALCLLLQGCGEQPPAATGDCRPTLYDEIGPFYRPNAPVRDVVGVGYLLSGTVRSAGDCRPLPGARIEFWLVNPQGQYSASHRATVHADSRGRYRFQSNRPTAYVGRPPHIHIMVIAEGHERLITQHYPGDGAGEAFFDLVLERAAAR